jgi:pimeloyl-ACP methyl ester carboxylesterase
VLLAAPLTVLLLLVLPAAAPPADAAIAFASCGNSNDFACGHLTVPLDPSGATPGTITLAIRRHRAPVGEARTAVVALAGGPGQSAIPFAEDFLQLLGPVLSTRDLIVFDQRGTGLSHPLSCHAFEHPNGYRSLGSLIESCAGQLGPSRAFYTTPDSVADIEAIRQAGGYEKLVLYGTSYGTKVAEEYAQAHPEHVEALILDSVVPPNGPETLDLPTFQAIPRILRQLCSFRQCAHITANPVADLARLVRRMHAGPVGGRVIDGHGHAHTVRVTSGDLLDILVAGDLDPILRSEFVPAVRAAAAGDNAPLARLVAFAESGEGEEAGEDIDIPLYYATSCEEQDFPWSRAVAPRERIAQARARLDSLPPASIAPFDAADVFALSDMPACAFWPFATPTPPLQSTPLPNVPALIFSGADDLRTPTSGARALAAQIPDAHVLVVPNTGHSVLGTEPTTCAREALFRFFAGKTIAACPDGPASPPLRPTPLPPRSLAAVAPAHGYRGRAGRTLRAVRLTLANFAHELLLEILKALGAGSGIASTTSLDTGGLRAGWAQLSDGALRFHDYTYVPGVSISGVVHSESATLRIGGAAAAHGTLRLGPHRALVGTLGGAHVRIASQSTGATALQASAGGGSRGDATRAAAPAVLASPPASVRLLQRELERMPAALGSEFALLEQLWATRRGATL